jgi:hypothetical protein
MIMMQPKRGIGIINQRNVTYQIIARRILFDQEIDNIMDMNNISSYQISGAEGYYT